MTEPHTLTATEAIRRIEAGQLTPESLLRSCRERIALREPATQAWTHLAPIATSATTTTAQGPLRGIPFGAKDIIDTADMPTAYGSPIHAGFQPCADAACVALTRRAGGILVGKTVTTEFANLTPGPTRNPHDPLRTPGGSSSGSAAAVGDLMVPLALGTQTTASTIRPAAYCGVYGFIPSQSRLSTSGVRQSSWTLDRLGLFSRSAADIALWDDVLRGGSVVPLPQLYRAPRIGFCRTHLWPTVEPSVAAVLEDAAHCLGVSGAEVADVLLPAKFEAVALAQQWISSFEFTRNYAWEIDHHVERISPALRNGRIADGLACPEARYLEACETASQARLAMDALFDAHDVLLTVSAGEEAPVGTATGNYAFCALWTIVHVPCVTIPGRTGKAGLPVGVQLIGRRGDDRRLLAIAEWAAQRIG